MKLGTILLAGGAAVAGYFIYTHYFVPKATVTTPGEELVNGISSAFSGLKGVWSSLTGSSSGTSDTSSGDGTDDVSAADATSSARVYVPQPGALLDLDRAAYQQRTPKTGLGRTSL